MTTRSRVVLAVMTLSILACRLPSLPTPAAQPQNTPVMTSTPTLRPTATATADTATILRPVVNLRAEAGGEVVESVTAGTVVAVIECGPEWCQVEYMEQIFYIWRGCLDGYQDGRGCEAE
jgi:hypothetical protein